MNIVVDTHILLKAATKELSPARTDILESGTSQLYVSSITLWEITKLHEHSRIELEDGLTHFLEKIYRKSKYSIVELTPEILGRVPGLSTKMGKDPADQIIVATALELTAKLMTDDSKIIASGLVEVL